MVEDELLKTIKELQKKIEYDEEKTYSKIVIREFRNPTNFGVIENPDADGTIKGSCGDTMKITLKIVKGKIQDARFWTDGCGATLGCGNMLTKMIIGKTPRETLEISQWDLITNLDGLPKEYSHCAKLTVITLNKALEKHVERK
jgi:nitrogen fixation NifU-like protein